MITTTQLHNHTHLQVFHANLMLTAFCGVAFVMFLFVKVERTRPGGDGGGVVGDVGTEVVAAR